MSLLFANLTISHLHDLFVAVTQHPGTYYSIATIFLLQCMKYSY